MRTEEEVLEDFRKIGTILKNDENMLFINILNCVIEIDKKNKCYFCYDVFKRQPISEKISLNEHKLINELFKIWGWL